MRATIIGPGNMGRGIATRLVEGGHAVTLVGRDRAQAEEALSALRKDGAGDGSGVGSLKAAGQASEAVPESDVVILALPYTVSLEEASRHATLLDGKVVIDISNPLNDSYTGLITEGGPSGAERIRERLPAGARLVKAFNTTFAPTLLAGEVRGEPLDVFIAGDDEQANETVAELVRSSGMTPVVVGALERARQLEGLGFLGISIQEPLGTGFLSGWKLLFPDTTADDEAVQQRGFPRDAVVGALEPEAVERVTAELKEAGFAADRVNTLAGRDAHRSIRESMKRTGRTLDFLFGFETEHSRNHLRELEAGHTLVIVWVAGGAEADQVGAILARHDGHYVNYYSRWTARVLAQ